MASSDSLSSDDSNGDMQCVPGRLARELKAMPDFLPAQQGTGSPKGEGAPLTGWGVGGWGWVGGVFVQEWDEQRWKPDTQVLLEKCKFKCISAGNTFGGNRDECELGSSEELTLSAAANVISTNELSIAQET